MSRKRQADVDTRSLQLSTDDNEPDPRETHTDDPDDAGKSDDSQSFQVASDAVLKQRVILKARRPAQSGAATALPAFNFGAPPASSAAAAPVVAVAAAAPPVAPPRTLADIAAAQAASGWECPVCDIRNKHESLKCAACQTPRADAEAASSSSSTVTAAATPVVDAPKFTFGAPAASSSSSSSSSAANAPTFSFGSFTASSSSGFVPAAFKFGSSSSSFSPSVFNPFTSAVNAAGTTDASAAIPTFTFGSGLDKSGASTFSSIASGASESSESDFAAGESSGSSFTSSTSLEASSGPIEAFKGKVAESSGEESDTIHFRQQCKVFAMQSVVENAPGVSDGSSTEESSKASSSSVAASAAPKWVEIGAGDLHVNTYTSSGTGKTQARLIMRTEKTHRLVLNAPLLPRLATSFALQGDKFVKIASVELQEAEKESESSRLAQYLFKVGSKQEANTLLENLTKVTKSVE